MQILSHQTSSCEIIIEAGAFDGLAQYLERHFNRPHSRILIVSDEAIDSFYGERVHQQIQKRGVPSFRLTIPAGDSFKTLASVEQLWSKMHEMGLDRQSLVLALGGGVVGDVVGFAASCYLRGIDLVQLPTTLLAMVDSAIGGKTGVNLEGYKNIIGSFYQPRLVIGDLNCLKTLPPRGFRSGLAEVIKCAVIRDPELFLFLEKNKEEIFAFDSAALEMIVHRSCAIKSAVVNKDEKDCKGIRAILNWGHTFAHAIETYTDHSRYLHGEAVAIGMSCAAHLSVQLGLANEELITRQDALLHLVGLDTTLPDIPHEAFLSLMAKDKKATSGKLSFIVTAEIGNAYQLHDVDSSVVLKALAAKKALDERSSCKN